MYLDEVLELLESGKKRGARHREFLKNEFLCYFTYAQVFYITQNGARYNSAIIVSGQDMIGWPRSGWE